MNAKTIVKAALFLVAITALFYWQEIWAWVSAKTWSELTGDILGFVLKWFFLAIFGFLTATLPHYVAPWLKLFRHNGRMKLRQMREVRRFEGSQVFKPPSTPTLLRTLLALLSKQTGVKEVKQATDTQPQSEIKLDF